VIILLVSNTHARQLCASMQRASHEPAARQLLLAKALKKVLQAMQDNMLGGAATCTSESGTANRAARCFVADVQIVASMAEKAH
jgi:hypothetical protein